jgi:uncharacterized protein
MIVGSKIVLRTILRHWREALLAITWLLPLLTLPALGLLWLWQNNLTLVWWLALLGGTAALLAIRFVKRPLPRTIEMPITDEHASTSERQAREALALIATGASARDVASRQAVEALIWRSIEAVAKAHNPATSHPTLKVTVPELLAMTEDVAARLGQTLVRDFPLLRHVEIRSAVQATDLIDPARKAWNVWRVVRALNPVTAIVQEVRAFIVSSAVDVVGEGTKARIAATIVREVGDVAIRLYAGGYREHCPAFGEFIMPPSGAAATIQAPLTVLIAGQPNAGKTSLMTALSEFMGKPMATGPNEPDGSAQYPPHFTHVDVIDPEAGALRLVDSPSVGWAPSADWLEIARAADLVVWVSAANRADRAADQRALSALREAWTKNPKLRATPVVLAVTHADRVAPPLFWAPPYDPENGQTTKEINMRAALCAAGEALGISADQRVLIAIEPPVDGRPNSSWNLDAVLRLIRASLPAARKKQRERGRHSGGWMDTGVDLVRTLPRLVRPSGPFNR